MSQKIINLTTPMVIEEIESVLETYSDDPYQKAFAIPDLRQQLIAYVLSHVRNVYTVVEDEETPLKSKFLRRSLEQRLHMEPWIRHGIVHILQENTNWVSHPIPAKVDSGYAPASWFG